MGMVVWEVFQNRGRARLDLTAAHRWGGPCGLGPSSITINYHHHHQQRNLKQQLNTGGPSSRRAHLELTPACQLALTSATRAWCDKVVTREARGR